MIIPTHDEMAQAHDLAMDFMDDLGPDGGVRELGWDSFAIMCGISNLILPLEGDVRVLGPEYDPDDFRAMADTIERHLWRATAEQAEALAMVAALNRALADGDPIFTLG